MNIFRLFQRQCNSANLAKERLKLIVSEEKNNKSVSKSLPIIEHEIAQVLNKYIKVQKNDINLRLHQQYENDILELNVVLPNCC